MLFGEVPGRLYDKVLLTGRDEYDFFYVGLEEDIKTALLLLDYCITMTRLVWPTEMGVTLLGIIDQQRDRDS